MINNYTIDDMAMLTPMRYYNNENDCPKRQEMLNNYEGNFIASEKHDGCWSMLIHYSDGHNLIRSRSISKVTGKYGDYTAKVPHIVAEMNQWPDNTVLLAELCWDEYGTNANTVGTILRCLPEKAVARQKDKKLSAIAFDFLMVNGSSLMNLGYADRLLQLKLFLLATKHEYIFQTDVFMEDFCEHADDIISRGGEGCVIQRKDNIYDPGTRTAWKTLKLKQKLPEMELKVVGVLNPNKDYDGDYIENWKYFDKEGHPVTKPYYMGWKNGITVELSDGTRTDVASGLTDADREWLATKEAAEMIGNGELFAVVKAMSFNDKGRLRHPSLVRLRNDL